MNWLLLFGGLGNRGDMAKWMDGTGDVKQVLTHLQIDSVFLTTKSHLIGSIRAKKLKCENYNCEVSKE